MKWIPSRDLKIEVDCLSRVIDLDDYALNVDMFKMLDVNVSTHDCEHENNWLLSPLFLIVRTINNLKLCKAEGSIVVSV